MYSTEEKRKLMDSWEKEITDIALRGIEMKPQDEDLPRLRALADMILDLSEGKNEVIFDKLGRPSIMVNFFCDEKAWLQYLSGNGQYFDATGFANDKVRNIAPAFIVGGKTVRGFRLGKYKDVEANGKNYHLSLFGLPPAYGSGGVTESYDGLAAENDRINAGSYPGEKVHNITRAEWCYLALRSVTEGFQVRGANNSGRDGSVSSEAGTPCGYFSDGAYRHVLTGSGPNAWRHDGTPFGVWGLNGPTYDILHGFITDAGKLLYLPNNDAAAADKAALSGSSASYKGLMPDGTFAARETPGILLYDYKADPGASGSHEFELATSYLHQQVSGDPYGGTATGSIAAREGVSIPLYARLMLNAPLKKNTPRGTTYMRNQVGAVRCPWAGAYWWDGASGGFGRFDGNSYILGSAGSIGSGRLASLII